MAPADISTNPVCCLCSEQLDRKGLSKVLWRVLIEKKAARNLVKEIASFILSPHLVLLGFASPKMRCLQKRLGGEIQCLAGE